MKRKMGGARSLNGAEALQVDQLRARVIEETHTLTQEHMGNAHLEFVEQPRFQCLLDRTRSVKGNTFLAGQLLCFGYRALDAVGDGRGVDQLLWRHDLAVDAARPVKLTLGRTHAIVPDTPGSQIDGADGNGVGQRRLPALEMLCFGEHLEHEHVRCVEEPFHDELLFYNATVQ